MDKLDQMADAVAEALKGIVTREIAALRADVAATEALNDQTQVTLLSRIEALEKRQPEKGEPGKDAEPEVIRLIAAETLPGMVERAQQVLAERMDARLEALPTPANGKSAYDIACEAGYKGSQLEWLASLKGTQGDPGREGEPGREAYELDIRSGVDIERSYPRGTCAQVRGGLLRASRNTDPVTDGKYIEAGWTVLVEGIAEEFEETLDEGRTIKRTTVYTSGKSMVREIKTSIVIDRGVWREGPYEKGDGVTWGGSWFIVQKDMPQGKPGESDDFRLTVKRGRDGKDAAPIAKKPEPVRLS